MLTKQQRREYRERRDAYFKRMRNRGRSNRGKHIDKDGKVTVPIFMNGLGKDQELLVAADDTVRGFLDQVQDSLKNYDPRRPAVIRVYCTDDVSEEYRDLFLQGVRRHTYERLVFVRNDWRGSVRFLMLIFVLGLMLLVANNHLKAVNFFATVTEMLDVVNCVMMWTLVDYLIRTVIPSLQELRRAVQIGTAELTISKWK